MDWAENNSIITIVAATADLALVAGLEAAVAKMNLARMSAQAETGNLKAARVIKIMEPAAFRSFAAARALSKRNDSPETASRPWDKDRDGFVLGDGAGVIILEELEQAKKRNAKIYAEVTGYGMSADAFHMTLPSETGEGAHTCMKNAITDAEINSSEINYINAHGTSTPAGDVVEVRAIKSTFGEESKKIVVNSTKSVSYTHLTLPTILLV